MEKTILEKIITKEILNLLNEHIYLDMEDIDFKLKKYDLKEEELELIMQIIANSKLYNHITLQNGQSYIFGKTQNEIKCFISLINISENDNTWNEYVSCNGYSYQLNYFID